MHRHLILALWLKEETAEEQCASQLVSRGSKCQPFLLCSPALSLAELHVPVGLVKPQVMMPEPQDNIPGFQASRLS